MSVDALLSLAGTPQGDAMGLMLGTVTDDNNTLNSQFCTVLLDGAVTGVTVRGEYDRRPANNDRVIVARIAKSLFLVANLTAYAIVDSGTKQVTGPYPTAAPANSTTGTTFTINRPGYYALRMSGTAMASAAGTINLYNYIDGAFVVGRSFRVTTANVHQTLPLATITRYLSRGTHYWALYNTGTSDGFDSAEFSWTRLP